MAWLLCRRSTGAAAKSKEGASAPADGLLGPSEPPVQLQAAAKAPVSRARAGGSGRGRGSRAKSGSSADAAGDISAPAATGAAAAAAAPAADGRGAHRRPGRGRRRTTPVCAALPGSTAGTSARRCSGLPGASGAASQYSTLVPQHASAAATSCAGLLDKGVTCRLSSSSAVASQSYLASPELWVYSASPTENDALADRSGVSQSPSLDHPSASSSAADINISAAAAEEPPDQELAAKEDAWCYVTGSPKSISPHQSEAALPAEASPRDWQQLVRDPPRSAGHTTSPEPVCLVSDSDTEAPLSRFDTLLINFNVALLSRCQVYTSSASEMQYKLRSTGAQTVCHAHRGSTGHKTFGCAPLLQQSVGISGKVQKRARCTVFSFTSPSSICSEVQYIGLVYYSARQLSGADVDCFFWIKSNGSDEKLAGCSGLLCSCFAGPGARHALTAAAAGKQLRRAHDLSRFRGFQKSVWKLSGEWGPPKPPALRAPHPFVQVQNETSLSSH